MIETGKRFPPLVIEREMGFSEGKGRQTKTLTKEKKKVGHKGIVLQSNKATSFQSKYTVQVSILIIYVKPSFC